METAAPAPIHQLHQGPGMEEEHYDFRVTSLAGAEERGVAVVVNSVHLSSVLDEELYTIGMSRESRSMESCVGGTTTDDKGERED